MRKVQAAGADGDGIATPVKKVPEKKAHVKPKTDSAKRAKSAAVDSEAESGMFQTPLTHSRTCYH
jgi:hypothetical protein